MRAVGGVALDWRVPRARTAANEPSVISAAAPADERAVVRGRTAATAIEAPAEAKATAPRDKAPVLALDASTIDRLADNVMQRIDRRTRIERERRGL